MNAPHVLVIGGGIGGLCLAQGLRAAGVPVTVHERDTHPAGRWEGYRIHIDPAGARSLRACLPDRLWRAFLDLAAPGGDFGFLTERLTELLVVEEEISHPRADDPAEGHYAVDRRALRRLLLAGIEDVVHFGAEFERYEVTDDGRVVAHFADGSSATGDLLVGADGTGSRVRRQYLPHGEPVAAGVVGLANKLVLTDGRGWVPGRFRQGMNLVTGDGPYSLFTAAYQPPPGAERVLAEVTGRTPPPIDQPYLLTALVSAPDHLPPDIGDFGPDRLREVAAGLVADWHPVVRRMIDESEDDSRGVSVFRVAPQLPPWPSSRVTLLGDAIHAVPATGGLGGNAALRDARRLTQLLATTSGDGILDSVRTYERDLREHGYAAVRDALAVRDQMVAGGTLDTIVSRTWMRLCRYVTPLRRHSFGSSDADVSHPRPWELASPA
ncbi:FAD-dependent oxidoreductase [Actinoalloteichus caeruleus]|uniref:2-polyprenyl-6-methoxyphenol hydroxylase n=1 Tax=Actinoalloteichus caeruleus DSM 43889 TaxID=1120930 RepID=A0ABT1JQ47_ACTCY|nr:FAD-dependent monooxygenase [Actinoalloteichus caeruleus]MCP2334660.1 2-polyprenyl-6-methoxyphenol hydroxylase [Actinoalloteichus caeruleus DSM 43889]